MAGNNLPSAYQEVEYIESTGTQWIDTGYNPSDNTYFQVDFKMTPTILKGVQNYFYGATSTSGKWCSFESYQGNSYWNVGSATLQASHLMSINNTYEYSCIYDNGTFAVSGSTTFSGSYSGIVGNGNFVFFNSGTTESKTSSEKLYYLKLYSSANTLVRNLFPCYRKSDNVAGMYDTVNDVFYTNSGTGTFTVGPDVETGEVIDIYKEYIVCGSSRLPSAYQEVEYLQSSGTQYITNVLTFSSSNSKIQFDCSYQFTDVSNIMVIANSMGNQINLLGSSSEHPLYAQAGRTFVKSTSGRDLNKHTVVSILDKANQRQTLTVDGSTTTQGTVIFQSSMPISIFAAYDHSTEEMEYPMYGKIFYAKIYLDGTLVRNLVPCYRKSDSVAGMYDTVNNVFYTNSGTGTFTVGPDVETGEVIDIYKEYIVCGSSRLPSAYQEVEYLQSSGTQYIDTGIDTWSSSMKMQFKLRLLEENGYAIIGYTNSGSRFFNFNSKFFYDIYNSSSRINGGTATIGNDYELELGNFYIKDLTTGTNIVTGTTQSLTKTEDVLIFARKSGNNYSISRFYYVKIYEDGINLSRNLIPCYRKSDSVAGMYDLVNDTFYTNSGTGSFTVGDDVNSQEIIPIYKEYYATGTNTAIEIIKEKSI